MFLSRFMHKYKKNYFLNIFLNKNILKNKYCHKVHVNSIIRRQKCHRKFGAQDGHYNLQIGLLA
jgi:hypothetical protein